VFSGLEDKAENYLLVSYHIDKQGDNQVIFTWTQEGFSSEQGQQHSEQGLPTMLEQIKMLVEIV
jgi:hypothetical protein